MLKTLGASHTAFSVFKLTAQHMSEKFLIMTLVFKEKQQGKEG